MTEQTSKEIKVKPDDLIVLKTDKKGHIVYCNDAFMEYSGFYEEELLGRHMDDICRHPDMPDALYSLMGGHLYNEDEFVGYFKNLTKEGSYFWTLSNIMPNFNSKNELIGYMLISRCSSEEGITYFNTLYQEMSDIESKYDNEDEARGASSQVLKDKVSCHGGYDEFVCSQFQ